MLFGHSGLVLAGVTTLAGLAAAVPLTSTAAQVKLDSATFTGSTVAGISSFLGIPFAQPPTGQNRFNLPQPLGPYNGSYTVTSFAPTCPQQSIALPILTGLAQEAVDYVVNSIYGQVFPDDEDCLYLNVVKPAGVSSTAKLPVVAWIFGGGFELGSPSLYSGGTIVQRSIDLGQPVIYVSMNYRLNAFGFLPGKEVKAAGVGNLGLWDQRAALRWIQKYIGAFGGDPTKVTIWGESAGAISASLQMLFKGGDTEGLYRAAFMQSGAPIPVGPIENGQPHYDALVQKTGCSGSADTLACLRTVPYKTLKAAMNASPGIFSYSSLVLAWLPRTDGIFLPDTPQNLVKAGKFPNIPMVNGNNDDEGTLFSLSTLNITSTDALRKYISTIWLPKASSAQIDSIMSAYPSDVTAGSPYDTSILNVITPENKRISSFMGDTVFQAPRRLFLNAMLAKGGANTWSFINKRLKALPVLGSAHATDLLNVYGGGDMADYLVRFVATLNPGSSWPKYTASKQVLVFQDGLFPLTTDTDDFRSGPMQTLTNVMLTNAL